MDNNSTTRCDDIDDMRLALLRAYPRGLIRGQYIMQMSESQIYAIYKWHKQNKIVLNKPRLIDYGKQIPGQMSLF